MDTIKYPWNQEAYSQGVCKPAPLTPVNPIIACTIEVKEL